VQWFETVALLLQVLSGAVAETWLPHQKYQLAGSTGGPHLQHAAAGQAGAWLVEEVLL